MNNFVKTAVIISALVLSSQSIAATHPVSYEVKTGDVGTIKTVAATKSKAFVKAGNECFDRRVALYEFKRGQISEERMLDIIDSCANLKW